MVETAAKAKAKAKAQQGVGGSGSGSGELDLPPGFRFYPTPEEVVVEYLLPKVIDPGFESLAVGEVDLNSCEPRDLPEKANMGEKEWYFFVHKDMKYPTGRRANRATREGYWKATGRDREIFSSAGGELVGMKKTLVFYTGRAPRGGKTNWVMHEFRLDGKSREQTINNPKDEWVVCKVFNKKEEGMILPSNAGMIVPSNAVSNGEYSAGTTPNASSVDAGTTPNASSVDVDVDVDAGEVGDDFLDSMLDPLNFDNYMSSPLPANTTTATTTAAPPYNFNADYYYSVPTTAGSFDVMPNYSLTNTASITQTQVAAAITSSVPTSSSGGGYMMNSPPAHGHGMGRSYNVNQNLHSIMAKTLGGVIGASGFGVPLPANAPAIAGSWPGAVPQQSRVGSYINDGEYAYGNYDVGAASVSASAAAMNGQPAGNFC